MKVASRDEEETRGRTDAERKSAPLIKRPRASEFSPHVSTSPPHASALPFDRIPLIIGHRGASAHAPENTLAAFHRAFDDGADGIEFDVRLARDGVPVVIHDATLRRTGQSDRAVASLSSDELASADVGTWFNRARPEHAGENFAREGVPTLAQVFREVGARAQALYVELKFDAGESPATLVREVVNVVRAHEELAPRVRLKSFMLDAVAEAKRLAPELRAAALFDRSAARPFPSARVMIEKALACGADEISLQRTLARRRTVEAAREAGLDALVWTVDEVSWAKRSLELGLCAFITNHPARMRPALERLFT